MRALVALVTLVAAAGCVTPRVGSSALRTGPELPPSSAPVELSATRDVADAQELGLVEAWGTVPIGIDALASRFRARVAELGGDRGRVDQVGTTYGLVTERADRECGGFETRDQTQVVSGFAPDGSPTVRTETVPVTTYVSRICTEEYTREVATLRLSGRALRSSTSGTASLLGPSPGAGELAGVSVSHALTRALGAAPRAPVRVFFEGSPNPPAYDEIALVSATARAIGPGGSTLPLVGLLQAQAANLACDAVVQVRTDRGRDSATATGVAVRLR